MKFDPINKAACIVDPALINGANGGNTQDARCNDATFASAHPDICGAKSYLIIKPSSALIMRLSGVSYTVFEYANGVESQVTDSLNFTSSNPDIFLIGASSGSGTGLTKGSSVITVTRNGLSASASVTVLDSTVGCSETEVKSLVLVDNSSSSSLSFGGVYQSRLDFAKAAANKWSDHLIQVDGAAKDGIKVWSFAETLSDASSDYLGDTDALNTAIDSIQQQVKKTDIFDTLNAAILDVTLEQADEKVILLISDGEQTTSADTQPVLNSAAAFKAAGGIIVVVGLRASGAGFDLLERIATGGFFMSATAASAASVLDGLGFLKSAVCLGTCLTAGDVYVNTAQLDYSSFKNWEVIKGQVDLIGNGEYDYLPGNGLYVDMVGSHGYTRDNTIRSIDRFALVAGSDYTIAFRTAGNNRQDVGQQSLKVYLRNPDAPATDANIFEHTVSPVWNSAFQAYSFTFTSPISASAKIYFQQVLGATTSDSAFGNLLDDIVLSDGSLNVLLDDDFDTENPVYVPPACGVGTVLVETSTGSGGRAALVPIMTGPNTPSGAASASSNSGGAEAWRAFRQSFSQGSWGASDTSMPQWIQYQFPSKTVVNEYTFLFTFTTSQAVAWSFQGSNDGVAWVTLDSKSFVPSGTLFSGTFTNATAYFYYRVYWTVNPAGASASFFQLYGPTQTVGYGFITGYGGCYSDSCSQQAAIGAQFQDPNPLPDIESPSSGVQLFTSTKNFCASCLDANVNVSDTGLIPKMTSNTAPSGVVSASSTVNFQSEFWAFDQTLSNVWNTGAALPQWIAYKFASVVPVSVYAITAPKALTETSPVGDPTAYPTAFTFEGSNDGISWTVLDTRSGLIWQPNEQKLFALSASQSYSQYRVNVSATTTSGFITCSIAEIQLYGTVPVQVCKTANATSLISQSDADTKALNAATLAANSALNCVHIYTSTQLYAATCPLGNGSPVTKSATATSFVSQADADASALATAKALAIAAIDCSASNNTQQITINDNAAATPYPSVKVVSGLTGHITKVTVAINGLRHTYPNDISVMLVSPAGTKVNLFRNCGGQILVTGINLVLDDAAGGSLNGTTMASGTFKPTQLGVFAPFPQPCPSGSPLATLAAFIGEVGNGGWALYVQDTKSQDSGLIATGWNLTITSA